MSEPEIISRAEAKQRGLRQYFTGRPCKHGHVAPRYIAGACIACFPEWRKKNRAKLRTSNAARRISKPEMVRAVQVRSRNKHRERRRQQSRKWRASNREKVKLRNAKWRDIYRERLSKLTPEEQETARLKKQNYYARWRKDNSDLRAVHNRNREALKVGSGQKHTKDDVSSILQAQRNKCAFARHGFDWCKPKFGKSNKPHVDHIIPLSRGGGNGRRNLQALCAPCNIRKRNKDQIEFLRKYGVLL